MSSVCLTSNRLTSEKIVIEFLPYCAVATHVASLNVGAATGGTYRLSINGAPTATINYDALNSAVQTAINDVAGSGAFTVTGTAPNYTITAAADGLWDISVYLDSTTGGSAGANVKVTTTTQGSENFVISGELSSWSYSLSVDTTDMTPLSQKEEIVQAVKEMLEFEFESFYSTNATETKLRYHLVAGLMGTFTVYPEGKGTGLPFHQFKALLESVDWEFPDKDKVTLSVSGRRLGADIYRMGSLQL